MRLLLLVPGQHFTFLVLRFPSDLTDQTMSHSKQGGGAFLSKNRLLLSCPGMSGGGQVGVADPSPPDRCVRRCLASSQSILPVLTPTSFPPPLTV